VLILKRRNQQRDIPEDTALYVSD